MKTKKTAKIISSVLALVMLVCSLSAVSGFVTSADDNQEVNPETTVINNLKTAWSSMHTETKIADIRTDYYVQNFSGVKGMSKIGFTFKADNTVDKTAVNYDDVNIGLGFSNKDQYGTYFFDSTVNNRGVKYADVFVDDKYDTLSVTLKTGTVTTAGKAYLLCTYSDYNSLKSQEIEITTDDSNKSITLDTKALFGKKLSELLKKGESDLSIIKIGFSKGLAFTGAEILQLNALKYAEVPSEVSNELLLAKALRTDTEGYVNADTFETEAIAYRDFLANGKLIGDVNGLDSINICDLVALNDLMPEGYDTDNTYSITGDMNTDGYITAEDTALLRAELLK